MSIKSFTTGEVLTAADTNTYLANSGLVYVKSQTIGSGVATVTVSDCFSATYDNYRILLSGTDASVGSQALKLTFGSTATGYYGSMYYDLFDGSATGFVRANNAANLWVGNSATDADTSSSFDCNNPFNAQRTNVQGTYSGGGTSGWFAGILANTTSYTAFTLGPNTGTFTGGTISVYGYRKA
jgi:hypothetical protein